MCMLASSSIIEWRRYLFQRGTETLDESASGRGSEVDSNCFAQILRGFHNRADFTQVLPQSRATRLFQT
jgi:hypothetical protein